MGHPSIYESVQFLAQTALNLLSTKDFAYELERRFKGISAQIEMTVLPEGEGRCLLMTFRKLRSKRPRPQAGDEGFLRRWKRERKLVVRPGIVHQRLEHPQTWRRATRKELEIAPPLGSPNAPFLAGNLELCIANDQSLEEIVIQLMVILHQWKLVKLQWEDWERLRACLRGFFRKPRRLEQAIEKAAEQIVKNWVSPDTPLSFRSYAKQTVRGIYANELRREMVELTGTLSAGGSDTGDDEDAPPKLHPGTGEIFGTKYHENVTPEVNLQTVPKVVLTRLERRQFEQAGEHRMKRSVKVSVKNSISPYELALASGIDHRRIYEAIKANELKAFKHDKHLRIALSDAQKWLSQPRRRLHRDTEILDLRKRIAAMEADPVLSKKKAASLRKWEYRQRKAGKSDDEIAEALGKN